MQLYEAFEREATNFNRATLKDQIYARLRYEICYGKIPQGTRLLEPEIAATLDTSITPVREALNKLAGSGLVVNRGRNGTYVVELSSHDVANLFALRESLERLAVRQAGKKLTPQDIEELERTGVTFFIESPGEREFETRDQANSKFHGLFLDKADNPWLKETMTNLSDLLLLARAKLERSNYRPTKSEAMDHQVIVNHLKNGDIIGAEEAMGHHIRIVKDYVLEYLSQTSKHL